MMDARDAAAEAAKAAEAVEAAGAAEAAGAEAWAREAAKVVEAAEAEVAEAAKAAEAAFAAVARARMEAPPADLVPTRVAEEAAAASRALQPTEAKEAPTKVPAQEVPYKNEGATAESIGKATVLIKRADTCMEVGSPDYDTDDALDYLVQGTCWRVSPCYISCASCARIDSSLHLARSHGTVLFFSHLLD
jgi:hypothetical protein